MMAPGGREATVSAIAQSGVVAVIRLADGRALQEVAEALGAGGVHAVEVTMTVPDAVAIVGQLARALPAPFLIGAGTVLDTATAERVIDAGASFVVSPILNRGVIEICRHRGVAVMPGCFTPTEILTATDAGADIVKVFPASALGPAFFSDLRAPLPHLRLMPTGGVTRDNAGEWIRAGAVAIGVGSALVEQQAVRDRRFDQITASARHFVAAVAAARPHETVRG